MSNYDAIFHLVTAANGAIDYYTTLNNAVRTESAEEASVLDEKTLLVWRCHQHHRIIDNSGKDFKQKMEKLSSSVIELVKAKLNN